MNDGFKFDASSDRARKARLGAILDSSFLRQSLWFVVIACLLGWGWLLFSGVAAAHLLIAPVGMVVVLLMWYYGDLKELKPVESIDSAKDLSSVLSRDVLAKIKSPPTPKQLAAMIGQQEGSYFFATRFGLSSKILADGSADDVSTTGLVWSKATELARHTGVKEIDSGILAGAIILSMPAVEQKLAAYELDVEDIINGVEWYTHIQRMLEIAEERHHFGGIGRDLSFGWAPLLNHVGQNLTEYIENGGFIRRPVPGRQQVIDQVIRLLAQQGRRNATLVGETGVGKTNLVFTLAQYMLTSPQNLPREVTYQQVISLDASHLIVNAKGRGELEGLLIRIFNEAISAKNVVIFLDEAQLFLRDGTGSVDLSNLLMPILEGGQLKIILSLNDQEWLRLSQTNPGLAQLMNRVIVKPLEREETIQVVEDEVILLESKSNAIVYMYQSINAAYKLAERFIHEQAFPGKAIKLLESAANFPEQTHFITRGSVQRAVEQSFDVKVQAADNAAERDTLLNLEDRIHRRMINQSRAVKLVSDALRRARTGVRNENKPIGTFLFLGPTGVGKTELSKALADVYFGGEQRLVRVDLNEYSHPEDTNRLLAVGANDPYSLCAQIAKQPFSVVLLDEIEKAHPNVLNLLLQMLDEGVLRDSANKPISFRDAIIIATSNAGAEQIRKHIENGQALEQFEDEFVDELINANVFRPEFLNRFDEIILFRPLNKEELVQLVDLLMIRLNKTLADRKVTVVLTQRAKEFLAERGYDPRLGARPLRRVVQRAVENVVAQKLLANQAAAGQTLELDAPELHQALDAR